MLNTGTTSTRRYYSTCNSRRHYQGINPPSIHCPIFTLDFWKEQFPLQFGLHSLFSMVIQLGVSVLSVTIPSATVMAAVTSQLNVLCFCNTCKCLFYVSLGVILQSSAQSLVWKASWLIRASANHPGISRICHSNPAMG